MAPCPDHRVNVGDDGWGRLGGRSKPAWVRLSALVDDEAAAGGAAAPELRVLVVEDNPELAGYLELEFEGEVVVPGRTTRVTLAEDLDTARKELSATSFDLVLLDLTLPDSQGLDTILGVIELCPASPIVVITGITDVDFGERALLTGAHDFLIKGRYTSADLRRCVRFAVARQRRALETQSALTSWSDSGTAGGAGVALADRPGEWSRGWRAGCRSPRAFPRRSTTWSPCIASWCRSGWRSRACESTTGSRPAAGCWPVSWDGCEDGPRTWPPSTCVPCGSSPRT